MSKKVLAALKRPVSFVWGRLRYHWRAWKVRAERLDGKASTDRLDPPA